jgi:hypothetical protein
MFNRYVVCAYIVVNGKTPKLMKYWPILKMVPSQYRYLIFLISIFSLFVQPSKTSAISSDAIYTEEELEDKKNDNYLHQNGENDELGKL